MAKWRHAFLFKLLIPPVKAFLRLRLAFSPARPPKIKDPCLILSNHTTDYDPLMVGVGLGQHMYFVASEHAFRRGVLSKLLAWAFDPIPRIKGSTDSASALTVLRLLKRGCSVCLFAEGDRSWNGVTGDIHPTTARLVKASKAPLYTYRISGGYMTTPRWSGTKRRGRMTGECVGAYSPQKLAELSAEELAALISRDINEDAYAAQRRNMTAFRGRELARGLEMAIYVCPQCKSLGQMSSEGDMFRCKCGLEVRYNEYGFFEGMEGPPPFETVLDWDRWQEEFLYSFAAGYTCEEAIFTDEDTSLWRISDDHRESLAASGILALYKDRLALGEFSIELDRLTGISIYGRRGIVLSEGGRNYEIKTSKLLFCGRKYMTLTEKLIILHASV